MCLGPPASPRGHSSELRTAFAAPPSAVCTALRSTAFFDGAGAGVPLLVLTCWALAHYLTFHSVVPAPRTILSGIRKLPPATVRVSV